MKRYPYLLLFIMILAVSLLLVSCELQSLGDELLGTLPAPSQSLPEVTEEEVPSETLEPVSEPIDSNQPTEPPPIAENPLPTLGERQVIPDGGFSFNRLVGYDTRINRESVEIFNPQSTLILSLYGVRNYYGSESHEQIIDEFLHSLEARGQAAFAKSGPYDVTIAGVQGTAFILTGTLYGAPIEGLTFVVTPNPTQFLYGMAASNIRNDPELWKKEGNLVFSSLVSTIQFLEGGDYGTNACPVADDPNYGYTKDNPVRIGGGEGGALAREEAYLAVLAGPNGEKIIFSRTGSAEHGGTILAEYAINYEGMANPITLYLDEINYAEPFAPQGFTCWTAIPLSVP